MVKVINFSSLVNYKKAQELERRLNEVPKIKDLPLDITVEVWSSRRKALGFALYWISTFYCWMLSIDRGKEGQKHPLHRNKVLLFPKVFGFTWDGIMHVACHETGHCWHNRWWMSRATKERLADEFAKECGFDGGH